MTRAFAADGPLAARIPGFKPRAQQLEMAAAIEQAIERNGVLIAEAGTGTGKTFAYLVPALLSGGKVIVSTGTKTLQDQLFDRDLPAVREALASGASAALLKGRSNYVCLYRLGRARGEARLETREQAAQLARIEQFSRTSATGDRADLADVPEDAAVWAHATSTRENCLGQECPDYRDCFVMRARRNALAADVVVVNHHLFFADVVLRDEGVAELLPACNTLVFDEAHQLPETARMFFGETVSSAQLVDLARDLRVELRAAGGASPELEALAGRLDKAARDLRLALGDAGTRFAWSQAGRLPGFLESIQKLIQTIRDVQEPLAAQAERSEGLDSCARRSGAALSLLLRMQEEGAGEVRWVEVFASAVQLHLTPLSSAELFQKQMSDHPRAWIFTSATLAVGEDFGHFTRELGVAAAETRRWASPFDFGRQALLYLPRGLPADPNAPGFTEAVVEAALPVLRASGGRAFLLFTTLRALRKAHELLRGRIELPPAGAGHRLAQRAARAFPRAWATRCCSAASRSGKAWTCAARRFRVVVIDKLPFAPPDDPVLAARIEGLKAREGNPFTELQLPQAVLQLKQGAGRLIRDETDRGVLMLCDPRLLSKSYGRGILRSLPPMKPSRELQDVAALLRYDQLVLQGERG